MNQVSKEFGWDMAHMLSGHKGLCQNVHGHTYKLVVLLEEEYGLISEGSSEGMVIDFKDLKSIVNNKVCDIFDHSFVANIHSTEENEIGKFLVSKGKKVVWFEGRSTAENMAKWIYEQLSSVLPVIEIHLWETPTNCAIHREKRCAC